MAITRATHWIGVFFLLLSAILLLLATVSAPIMDHNGLLRVKLTNSTLIRRSSVAFGTFGYCILDTTPVNSVQDYCSKRHIGYNPSGVIAAIDQAGVSESAASTVDGLTGVMILHPIASAFAFVAFFISIGAGIVGSLAGGLVALLAWILTLVAMAADFSMWGVLRSHINNDGSGSHAYFGVGIWCVVAAFVTLFFGQAIVLFTCFSNRREKKRSQAAAARAPARKKRFGII